MTTDPCPTCRGDEGWVSTTPMAPGATTPGWTPCPDCADPPTGRWTFIEDWGVIESERGDEITCESFSDDPAANADLARRVTAVLNAERPDPTNDEPTAAEIAAYIDKRVWPPDVLYEADVKRVLDARAALIREQETDQ